MRSVIPLSFAVALANAQSLFTPIKFSTTLDAYYYFRTGTGSIQVGPEGITITGDYAGTSAICDSLDAAEIVYYADGGEGHLLTANCWNVYHLINTDQEAITWRYCEEFPFYEQVCGTTGSTAAASSGTTTTVDVTGTASSDDYIRSQATTASSPNSADYSIGVPKSTLVQITSTTVVTTLDDGVVTSYTTWCPLTGNLTETEGPETTVVTITSCLANKCSEVPVTTGVTVLTTTSSGVETIYTTFCPLTASESPAVSTVALTTSTAHAVKSGSVATGPAVASGSSATAEASSSVAENTTETATTRLTLTASTAGTTVEAQASAGGVTTTAAVSTFEGAATRLGAFSAGLTLLVAGLFF